MSMLRLVVVALAGAACSGALGTASFAGKIQNFTAKQWDSRPRVFDERPDFFQHRSRVKPDVFQHRSRVKPDFFRYRKPGKAADRPRKRRLNVAGFDPEPRKPKSPDAGFDIYQPVRLVALSASDPVPSIAAGVLAAALLQELRAPESPLKVTAQQKDAIVNFYRFNYFRPLWVGSQGLNDKARRILALLANAEQEGLRPSDYLPASLGALVEHAAGAERNNATLARLDIGVTAMALRYAEHLHSGRIVPRRLSGYYDLEPPALNLGETLYQLSERAEPDLYLSTLAPSHPSYSVMKASLAAFRKESAERERQQIPAGDRVKPGGHDVRVPLVRARLLELGFLRADDATASMPEPAADSLMSGKREGTLDKRLSKALKAFQAANGIAQTGSIDKATVEDLNSRTDRDNAGKLILNMERLRWLPRELGERHVLVNQASFELRLIDRGDITWSTKVIVGTPNTQTAVFSDEMETVVINPYWGVPQSIIRYEMMPRLARDRRYLDREGYEVVNERGRVVNSRSVNWWAYRGDIPFGVRQPPGDGNALGQVKFLFPNAHDIYMHDTPTKELFAEPVRAFSHGCVRVENPREFAGRVLGWERGRIDAAIATGETRKIPLYVTLPVHLNYFTAWPDASGKDRLPCRHLQSR